MELMVVGIIQCSGCLIDWMIQDVKENGYKNSKSIDIE